jgi:hypothetical protein
MYIFLFIKTSYAHKRTQMLSKAGMAYGMLAASKRNIVECMHYTNGT